MRKWYTQEQKSLKLCEELGVIEKTGEYRKDGRPIYRVTKFGKHFFLSPSET